MPHSAAQAIQFIHSIDPSIHQRRRWRTDLGRVDGVEPAGRDEQRLACWYQEVVVVWCRRERENGVSLIHAWHVAQGGTGRAGRREGVNVRVGVCVCVCEDVNVRVCVCVPTDETTT